MLRINDFILYMNYKNNITTDFSLNAYSITNNSNLVSLTFDENFTNNNAIYVSGQNSRLVLPSTLCNAISTATSTTLTYYFRIETTSSQNFIYWRYDSGTESLFIRLISGSNQIRLRKEVSMTSSEITSPNNVWSTGWANMKITIEGVTVKFYYNSNLVYTGTFSVSGAANSNASVGRIGNSTESYNMKLKNYLVSNKILNELDEKFISKFDNIKRAA